MNRTSFRVTNSKTLQVLISSSSTKHRKESSKQSSQPIPIKVSNSKRECQESNDISSDVAYYDMRTWQMYNLITEARRIRAYNRLGQSDSCNASEYFLTGRNLCKSMNYGTVSVDLANAPGKIDDLQEQESLNSSMTDKEEKADGDGSHIFYLEI